MQTALRKSDIITWITGLTDKNVIHKLHQWKVEQETKEMPDKGIVLPKRKGSLTEGYGFWADDAPFDETNYRDHLWQTEKIVW